MTLVFLAAGTAAGETARLLRFSPSVIEFGTVRYDAGPVTVTFVCENISPKAVTILDVHAQCGCTKASFSREAIAPGATARVEVVLDPSTLYGEQNRHLTVIATGGDYRKFNTLTVHGVVERDQSPAEIRFPFLLGAGIRTELGTVGLRKRTSGEKVKRSVVLYNDSSAPVRLSRKWNWRIKGEVKDKVLAPGARTTLDFTYDTRWKGEGDFEDVLVLKADGKALTPITLIGTID